MGDLAIPGSARDDFDRLKVLWLRWNGRDLASPFDLQCFRRRGGGHGWTVQVVVNGQMGEERAGAGVAEVVSAWVADLARKLLLRWRSDGGALQLCGLDPEPFDPQGPEVVAGTAEEVPDRPGLPRAATA